MDKRVIIISESVVDELKDTVEMTEYKFYGYIKKFLHDLLVNPTNAQPNDALAVYGLNRSRLINLLLSNRIIEKKEKIVDREADGNPTKAKMNVAFNVPKQNFKRKLKKLYIKLFEKNVPEKPKNNSVLSQEELDSILDVSECDGGGGATSMSSVGGGSFDNVGYVTPLFGKIKRDINKKQ